MTAQRRIIVPKARATWDPIVEPRDKLTLGGHVSPGLCDIVGANSPRDWEEIRGPGMSGAMLRFRGVMPSHFSIKFRLYTRDDWADWNAFQPLVAKPPYGRRPRALDIVHPLLSPLGIRSVVIEDVKAPEQTSDSGEWTVEIKVIESRKRKSAISQIDGSQQTPVDPYELEIENQSKMIDELAQ